MSVSIELFRKLALSLPEITEEPHFEKTSFRVAKKIVATVNVTENTATIKLNEIEQNVYCSNPKYLSPVPNKWGKQGWTIIHLNTISEEMCREALQSSYNQVAPKRLKNK